MIFLEDVIASISSRAKQWLLDANKQSNYKVYVYKTSSLREALITFIDDFVKIKVSKKPTKISGIGEQVILVTKAATRTDEFAIISFLEQIQTEDMFKLSFLCFVKSSRQDKLAASANKPILDMV